MTDPITSDNIHLSRPKPVLVHDSAGDCRDLSKAVASYIRDSLAENTRRAYQSDLRQFEVWGGSLPASAKTVAAYLAAYADSLSVTTLIRRLASLSKAHQLHGLSNPIRSELVRATLRGIKRKRRRTALQAKPLLRDDLLLVLDAMGSGLKDLRDRAILLIGFAAALRRSDGRARRGRCRARATRYRPAPEALQD
jgi:site-specific recombinase XerD